MRLEALRTDLVLLAAVLAHPVRQWRRWQDLARELFGQGGATIDTPPAAEHEPIGARTVIQADGDILVFVDEASLVDRTLLEAHGQRVGRWYAESRAAVRQAAVTVRAFALTASVVVAATGGFVTSSLVNRFVGLAAFSALLTAGGWLFGRLASVLFRRRIDAVLRGAGVAG